MAESDRSVDYTREEVDEILSKGYPTEDELDHFPLGEKLKTIPHVNERYQNHIERVIEGVNILLGDNPHHIVKQWKKAAKPIEQEKFTHALVSIFGNEVKRESAICKIKENDFKPFFRLLAVYHDIGKYIIHERHPTVGWHLIRDVYRSEVEKQLYPLLLGIPSDKWEGREKLNSYQEGLITIFEVNIRFHDLFGVLSTGEASLPVMVDLISLTGMDPIIAKELFSILMLFNLADLYGSVTEITPEKVGYFCKDWELLCNSIEKAEGNRNRFYKILVELAKTPEMTIERIRRFMNEEAPTTAECNWRGEAIENRLIEVFKSATLSRMHTFCENFALFCKLDYALSFKKIIMDKACHEKMDPATPMGKILWLLTQLEKEYGELSKRNDGSLRRLGLQLAGLTRRPSSGEDKSISKIGDKISTLLLKTEERGKEWALSECTVWFMEE